MNFAYRCIDCSNMKTCPDAEYSTPACPAFRKDDKMNTIALKACLTKTQYKYWVEYFENDMTLSDIAIKYDVHITTVCHVLKNARKRIDEKYGEKVQ